MNLRQVDLISGGSDTHKVALVRSRGPHASYDPVALRYQVFDFNVKVGEGGEEHPEGLFEALHARFTEGRRIVVEIIGREELVNGVSVLGVFDLLDEAAEKSLVFLE